MATAQLKMKEACILCKVIEIFLRRKVTKVEKWRTSPSSSKWHWHSRVKTLQHVCLNNKIAHVQNVVKKPRENNRKAGKIGWAISQTPTFRLHDKIQAWWASDVPLESMLERVSWCRCFKMKFCSWTICCPMSYSNGGRHAQAGDGRRSHVTLRCCWKKMCCWWVMLKF
jgi:hypothetical protein